VCHNSNPTLDPLGVVLNGANSPNTITSAISSITKMKSLVITATDANNLAAYLATPGI
jgi:hypothetical protein